MKNWIKTTAARSPQIAKPMVQAGLFDVRPPRFEMRLELFDMRHGKFTV
jgi:hypothetical protein